MVAQHIWPTITAKPIMSLKGHAGGVRAMAFSPDRSLLAVSSIDGPTRLWDVGGNFKERGWIGASGSRFNALAFSRNRTLALGSGSLDGAIRVFDVSEKSPQELTSLKGGHGSVNALAFSPDGKLAAAAGDDRILRIWDVAAAGPPRSELKGHAGAIRSLMFTPDGQGLASGADDGVRLWAITRIRSWERSSVPNSATTTVTYSPDGRTLLTGSREGVIRLWNPTAAVATPLCELRRQSGAIRQLMMSSNGDTVVGVADGPKVTNWEMPEGLERQEWVIPAGEVGAWALTFDGRYVAIGGPDGVVHIYRVAESRST
jgi:WD40 repeat protein